VFSSCRRQPRRAKTESQKDRKLRRTVRMAYCTRKIQWSSGLFFEEGFGLITLKKRERRPESSFGARFFAATVTDDGASFTGQPVLGLRMWP